MIDFLLFLIICLIQKINSNIQNYTPSVYYKNELKNDKHLEMDGVSYILTLFSNKINYNKIYNFIFKKSNKNSQTYLKKSKTTTIKIWKEYY
jgi:hypothetical protein